MELKVVPDLYRNGHSVEAKNYDVETSSGRSNLNRELSRQYNKRLEHLPTGTSQTAVIDVRGQNVAPETFNSITVGYSTKLP